VLGDWGAALVRAGRPVRLFDAGDRLAHTFGGLVASWEHLLALPVYIDGRVQQWVWVVTRDGQKLSAVDMGRAMLIANLVGTHLSRFSDIRRLERAKAWIDRELQQVADLQRLLLPQRESQITAMTYAANFRASESVGGDYYDIVALSHLYGTRHRPGEADFWGVMIADSAGHGAAAAVEVAMFDAILRTYRAADPMSAAAGVFNYANPHIFTRRQRGTFMTACAMNYLPDEQRLVYCNAGHPPPLIRPSGRDTVYPLEGASGIPLGVERNYRWENAETTFRPGDTAVLYTDGVVEARSPAGEAFGVPRLCALIEQHRGPPQALLRDIEAAVDHHLGGAARVDDQTVIVVTQS